MSIEDVVAPEDPLPETPPLEVPYREADGKPMTAAPFRWLELGSELEDPPTDRAGAVEKPW